MRLCMLLLVGATSVALAHEGRPGVDEDHGHAHDHKARGLEQLGDESIRLPAADILLTGDTDVLSHYVGNNTNSNPHGNLNRPSGHNWTHTTPCFNSISSNDAFCVFADTSYANGHGISFITTAQRAAYLASLPSFSSPSTTGSSPPKYAVSSIPSKGLGLIVTTHISRGSVILSSHPTLMIDYRVFDELLRTDYISLQAAAISSLPLVHRSAFFNLSALSIANATAGGVSRIALTDSIITTNAFDIPAAPHDPNGDSLWYTTFASPVSPISRLNHDCRPNADYRFDWSTSTSGGLSQIITAVRDILPGEEITISYINPLQTRQARQKHLKTVWGFECGCEVCSRSKARTEESDRRVRMIKKARRLLKVEGTRRKEKMDRTGMAELLISLYELEGLWGMIYEAYAIAAREYSKVGEAWMAMKWAGLAVEFGAKVLGEEDEEVKEMKGLARDPWGHEGWRSQKKTESHEEEDEGEDGIGGDERPEGFELEDGVADEDSENGW